MTGPSLDLDALREARAWIEGLSDPLWPGLTESDWAGLMGRVLALVDEQRKENERLREALTYVGEFARAHHHQQPAHVHLHGLTIDIPEVVERALAGSPAENKEPS